MKLLWVIPLAMTVATAANVVFYYVVTAGFGEEPLVPNRFPPPAYAALPVMVVISLTVFGTLGAGLKPVPCPGELDMNEVMRLVRDRLPADAIITNDAGNFAQWLQRYYPFRRFRTQIAPCNGAMGYGVPAGNAAKVVQPERPVVTFVGDGGFLMTGSEIATAMQFGLAPVILVINNGMFGTIRQHQERDFPGRVSGTELRNPDFAKYAESFGAFAATVRRTEDFAPAFEKALECGRVAVLDIHLDPEALSPRTTMSALRAKAKA